MKRAAKITSFFSLLIIASQAYALNASCPVPASSTDPISPSELAFSGIYTLNSMTGCAGGGCSFDIDKSSPCGIKDVQIVKTQLPDTNEPCLLVRCSISFDDPQPAPQRKACNAPCVETAFVYKSCGSQLPGGTVSTKVCGNDLGETALKNACRDKANGFGYKRTFIQSCSSQKATDPTTSQTTSSSSTTTSSSLSVNTTY